MAREKGYERVACDRAEAVHPGGELPIVFMTPEDKRNEEWLDIVYTDKLGVPTARGSTGPSWTPTTGT